LGSVEAQTGSPVRTKSSAIADKPPGAYIRCTVLPSGERLRFTGLILRLLPTPSHLTPSMRVDPSSCRVHILYGKTRMAGLQSGAGCMMIDSVVLAQYINVTDTQTATSPWKMPRQRTASRGRNDAAAVNNKMSTRHDLRR